MWNTNTHTPPHLLIRSRVIIQLQTPYLSLILASCSVHTHTVSLRYLTLQQNPAISHAQNAIDF